MVLTSPLPTATQYIPFHAIRFTTVSLVSVFGIPDHDPRSADHAIDDVFKSFVGDPSPPTIHILPFHIIEYSTPVMGTLPAGYCVHVTPSLDVASFAPVTVSYPTAAHMVPFQNASLHTPPRNADRAILTVLAPHDLPPSVDIAAVAAAC
jgi:hypothetical protein